MESILATIEWERNEAVFCDNRYSRAHLWRFDGGTVVPGSSSPHIVPVPLSDAAAVDPEEAFVAALSSCHMLWFLSIAAQEGFVADKYVDEARGRMGKNSAGKLAMLEVTLRPQIKWSREPRPTVAEIARMHERAHEECFIANSVKTEVRVIE